MIQSRKFRYFSTLPLFFILIGAQNHLLRKVSSDGDLAFAAFLCFSDQSLFCVFQPVRTDGQFALKHLATIYSPEYDLIDFAISPFGRIVALWTNPDGIPLLRYAKFSHTKGRKYDLSFKRKFLCDLTGLH
jgi:hypothetical protein